MPDKSEMSDSENEQIPPTDDEGMVNQELENLENGNSSPSPQVSGGQTLHMSFLSVLWAVKLKASCFQAK